MHLPLTGAISSSPKGHLGLDRFGFAHSETRRDRRALPPAIQRIARRRRNSPGANAKDTCGAGLGWAGLDWAGLGCQLVVWLVSWLVGFVCSLFVCLLVCLCVWIWFWCWCWFWWFSQETARICVFGSLGFLLGSRFVYSDLTSWSSAGCRFWSCNQFSRWA